jgi:subtilase family serine protease
VKAVSTPGSAQYRRFLTVAKYQARFAPTADAVSAVSGWLRSSGMRVTGVASGNSYVAASGTVATAERTFGTHINLYRVKGRVVRSPASDISVPSSVSSAVLGVTGLDSAQVVKPAGRESFPPPFGFRNARPCSAWSGQLVAKFQADGVTRLPRFEGHARNYAVCGYTPAQFRAAYGVDASGATGAGATVAITDAFAAPTILQDANRYATDNGDAAFGASQFSQSPPSEPYRYGGLCGGNGWYGEETLDVEAVHGMAPDANVMYYPGRSCLDVDLLDALARVVDENKASIVTNSWGEPSEFESTGTIRAYEQVFQQGAMQGIGFMFSSGDSGDDVKSTGIKQTDYPTSDPWVTSVGGTSDGIDLNGDMAWQTGWGTDKYNLRSDGKKWVPIATNPFLYGAGGGFSGLFNRPSYQHGVVPQTSPAGRAVPDVGLDGDPTTGMLVGETQKFPGGVTYDTYRIGGTSLASPLFAGVQADATQMAGGRLGFANPAIYQLARQGVGAFNDVLSSEDANVRPDYVNGINPKAGIVYSVRSFDDDASLSTVPGWDPVTGIGSPNETYIESYGS